MPYLNVDLDYFTHRKVARLIGLIGLQHVAVPIRLWAYVGKHHCEDGTLTGYSVQEIESILSWKGKKGVLIDTLVTVGFLDKIEDDKGTCYRVHDWMEHAGHLAALKKRAKANAEKRWNSIARTDATSIPGSSTKSDASSNTTPMLPLNPLSLLSPLNPLSAGASAPGRMCAAHEDKIPPVMFKKNEPRPPGEDPPPEVVEKLSHIGRKMPA